MADPATPPAAPPSAPPTDPSPPPPGWTEGQWKRLKKLEAQRDEARLELGTLLTRVKSLESAATPPTPKDEPVTTPATPPTDPSLAEMKAQMVQMQAMLAASESARMKAEATSALVSQGIQDKAVQEFLLTQHAGTQDAPAFGEWLESAKAHPIYSRLLTPPADSTDPPAADTPPAPGTVRPPPAPSAPHQHARTPPAPGPQAFSAEAVRRMSFAERQKHAAEIARAAAADGEITLTDSLKKRLGIA